ncbi:MAG: ARMT1-like domain-containing protein [Bacillota bacterium]|nr:ARMT1-like domain-containing protein [Bacillota bacterium]
MRAQAACLPCYLTQALSAARAAGADPQQQLAAVRAAARLLPHLPSTVTPAENSWRVLMEVNRVLGNDDPFRAKKEESNRQMLALYPRLEKLVAAAGDHLRMALLLSVAGNVIDLGILPNYDVESAIKQAVEKGFAIDHDQALRKELEKARRILFLGDNAGEIVFDKLLARELGRYGRVTFAVKGGPILNDATRADAEAVGLAEVAEVIDNGNNQVGTVLSACSLDFKTAFRDADLILSKGQANFETLEEERDYPLFFLLRAKCQCVAEYLGVPEGSAVLVQGGSRPAKPVAGAGA